MGGLTKGCKSLSVFHRFYRKMACFVYSCGLTPDKAGTDIELLSCQVCAAPKQVNSRMAAEVCNCLFHERRHVPIPTYPGGLLNYFPGC